MSWGAKITVLYVGFVALIVTMVSMTMREKVDLVSKDYYQQELDYQGLLDKQQRTKDLGTDQLQWNLEKDGIVFTFPKQLSEQDITAEVVLFRPSDATLDRKFGLSQVLHGQGRLALKGVASGYYKIKVSWQANGVGYYNEGFIQIH